MRIFTAAAFVFLILLSTSARAQSDSIHNAAQELLQRGIEACDAGDYEEALDLYDQANEIDPGNSTYRYEEAYVHYARGDYQKAINVLTAIVDAPDASDRYYSLLGNGYDLIGKRSKAVATYKEGLKHFPNSGKIYLELGVIALTDEDVEQALEFWEKGIEVEPSHPSNYYWAAKAYCASPTRIWGIIYAEFFLNLERGTKRSKEISQLLYKAYQESIYFIGDTSETKYGTGVRFLPKNILIRDLDDNKLYSCFDSPYTMTMLMSLMGAGRQVDLPFLHALRTKFINSWYKMNHDEDYPNVLFDWNRELIELGYFEAYNYWLMNAGDEKIAAAWFQTHSKEAKAFMEWFKNHPLIINRSTGWCRTTSGRKELTSENVEEMLKRQFPASED